MRIVSRRSIDRLRRRHEHDDVEELEQPAGEDTSPPRVAEARSLASSLGTVLATLPPAQRRCWLLKEAAEYSYREIAFDLNIPETTVRGLISRARTNIVREMQAWR